MIVLSIVVVHILSSITRGCIAYYKTTDTTGNSRGRKDNHIILINNYTHRYY